MSDYFYDSQTRRYLLQMIRIFSDIKTEEKRDGGTTVQERIPVVYGDPSRMVANILRGGSDNTVMPSPMMSVWIKDIAMAPERRQDPTFVGIQNIIEREHSPDGGYGGGVGNMYTLQRYMPVPYNMTFQLDIWTTSTTTKLQIMEQLLTWFNPSLQLQQNSNQFDWTSLFEVILTSVQWSSRSVPGGSTTERDIASLTFEVPIWLNPPAKLKSKQWVEQIVTNIYDAVDLPDSEIDSRLEDPLGCFNELSRVIITPGDYKLEVAYTANGTIGRLIGNDPNILPNWETLLEEYGAESGLTDLYIKTDNDIESSDGDIIASFELTAAPDIINLVIDQDTVPAANPTISPVLRNVNPNLRYPGDGTLDIAAAGQRYLIVGENTNGEEPVILSTVAASPWGILTAYEGDIIAHDGLGWSVIFDAQSTTVPVYVVNTTNMQHYKFVNGEWIFTFLGEFNPGYWRLYSSK